MRGRTREHRRTGLTSAAHGTHRPEARRWCRSCRAQKVGDRPGATPGGGWPHAGGARRGDRESIAYPPPDIPRHSLYNFTCHRVPWVGAAK